MEANYPLQLPGSACLSVVLRRRHDAGEDPRSFGPITLPEIVDRPQLVLRLSANRVEIAEQHRWAGSLENDIARVIGENLSRLLGSPRVALHDQNPSMDVDYRVFVDIQRFESVRGEAATIEALWTLQRTSDGLRGAAGSVVSETVQDDSYDALVAAHGRALARIRKEIATGMSNEDPAGSQSPVVLVGRVSRPNTGVRCDVRRWAHSPLTPAARRGQA